MHKHYLQITLMIEYFWKFSKKIVFYHQLYTKLIFFPEYLYLGFNMSPFISMDLQQEILGILTVPTLPTNFNPPPVILPHLVPLGSFPA